MLPRPYGGHHWGRVGYGYTTTLQWANIDGQAIALTYRVLPLEDGRKQVF